MIFSFKKLKEIANLSSKVTIEDVVNAINKIGFEVESYDKFTNVEGIKFGRVKKVYPNPNGTKLNVCVIEFDDTERTIQTTAQNVVAEQIVIAFIPGSRIGSLIVEKKELKKIPSEGMLSSLSEFGIPKELIRDNLLDGITSYPQNIDIMEDPIKYLGLDDYIIDVSILSNRSDANSYYVMGMELAGYFQTNAIIPEIKKGNLEINLTAFSDKAKSLVLVQGKNNVNISIKEQIFLAKNGIKSVSDAVDITNLTLLYSGQPAHAYDENKVGDNFNANLYTGKVKILGNKEIELQNDLVILSNKTPVSLAGVIGFEDYKVSSNTPNIIFELGRFNIKEIRKSIKAAKINTSSSNQSSKEIAKGTTSLALRYLTNKLINFSNPVNHEEPTLKEVLYDVKKVSMLAGMDISQEQKYNDAIIALEKQGFKFNKNKVIIPAHRHDIESQQDLNEEIFRFYGYDNFKPFAPKIINFKVQKYNNLESNLVVQGYTEVKTYSLTSEIKNVLNPFDQNIIKLQTFVSKEREEIRNSQVISLLEIIEYHQKRKINDISIFDIGMIGNDIQTVALASTVKSFNEIKKDILSYLPTDVKFLRSNFKNAHPNATAVIMLDGKKIGWIGKINPSISKSKFYFAEWINKTYKSNQNCQSYNSNPLKFRDITFVLDLKEDINSKLHDFKDVYSIKIIDEFIKENKKHITIRIKAEDEAIKIIDNKKL